MRQKIPAGGGRSRRRRRQRSYFLQLALAASLVAAGAWLLVVVAEKVIHPTGRAQVGQRSRMLRETGGLQKALPLSLLQSSPKHLTHIYPLFTLFLFNLLPYPIKKQTYSL
jgi:hypothetical protein